MRMRSLRERIEESVAAGDTLEDIQHDILDSAKVPEDVRDALWLYAWGLLELEHEHDGGALV